MEGGHQEVKNSFNMQELQMKNSAFRGMGKEYFLSTLD